jgi:HME family heavy-metal exporter
VQKQPAADSVLLTREVEKASMAARSLPEGVEAPSFLFKQADFIEHSVNNVAKRHCATARSWWP